MSARRVRCWPGLKRNASFSSSGSRKRIDLAAAGSAMSSATSRLWKLTLTSASMAFEQVERLRAVAAAPQRLARGGAEAADLLGLRGAALRAGGRALAGGHGRGDAVGVELGAAFGRDPVGGPGGREGGLDADVAVARGVECVADIALDDLGGGAAGIGRGNDDAVGFDGADDAEVYD